MLEFVLESLLIFSELGVLGCPCLRTRLGSVMFRVKDGDV